MVMLSKVGGKIGMRIINTFSGEKFIINFFILYFVEDIVEIIMMLGIEQLLRFDIISITNEFWLFCRGERRK